MPRGKRTVFVGLCNDPTCPNPGEHLCTMRFHKQDKQGVGWKQHVEGFMKYCKSAKRRVPVKFKEEKHSS